MATLIYTRRAFADLERISRFLADQGPATVRAALDVIADAMQILERHPLIGRPAEQRMRELVISRGKTGYVALYDYHPHDDLVVSLAVRHQREAGYGD